MIDYLQFKEWVTNAIKHKRLKDDDVKARLEAKRLKATNPRNGYRRNDEEQAEAERMLDEYETAKPKGNNPVQGLDQEMKNLKKTVAEHQKKERALSQKLEEKLQQRENLERAKTSHGRAFRDGKHAPESAAQASFTTG